VGDSSYITLSSIYIVLNGSSLALGFLLFYPCGEAGFLEFYSYLFRLKFPVYLIIMLFLGDASNPIFSFFTEELGEFP
jgi:hypothetical protein